MKEHGDAIELLDQAVERLKPYIKGDGFGYYPHSRPNRPTKRLWLVPEVGTDHEYLAAREALVGVLRDMAAIAESRGLDSTPLLLVESNLHGNFYQPLEDARLLCRRLAVAAAPAGDGVGTPSNAKLSPAELAKKHSVPLERLRKRLERWRYDHDTGYVDVNNAKKNEPRFLYDESAVMPVIREILSNQRRPTNVQRKKI